MIWGFASLVLLAGILLLAGKFLIIPAWTRWIALQERKLTIAEQRVNRPTGLRDDAIPVDLVAYAMQWDAEWARADSLKRLRELREETGSWDNVRTVLTQH